MANPPTFSNTPYLALTIQAGDILVDGVLPGLASPGIVSSVSASVSATTNQNVYAITLQGGRVVTANGASITLSAVLANGQQIWVVGKATKDS